MYEIILKDNISIFENESKDGLQKIKKHIILYNTNSIA